MNLGKPKIYWLVSYPKSGNTWCRIFLSNYMNNDNKTADINQLGSIPNASARFFIENYLGLESSELTPDEIAEFRLEAFRLIQKESKDLRIFKVHDSFPKEGEVNFYANDITAGVIYIVRNPFDVAVSFANHLNESVDQVIAHMKNEDYYFCNRTDRLEIQFPQHLSSWSEHVNSWLNNYNGNLLLIRYEDLITDPSCNFKKIVEFLNLDFDQKQFDKSIELSRFSNLKEQEEKNGFREKSPKTKNFFREGKSGGWKKYLTDIQVKEIVNSHAKTMERLNYITKQGEILI